jgi:muconolactone D-isomerase
MIFLVRIDVHLPPAMDPDDRSDLMRRELEVALRYQREGRLRNLWRIVGKPSNFGLYEVDDNEELHQMISSFPLFPFMTTSVTPLASHPSVLQEHPDDSSNESP